jgi:beta-glucosidase
MKPCFVRTVSDVRTAFRFLHIWACSCARWLAACVLLGTALSMLALMLAMDAYFEPFDRAADWRWDEIEIDDTEFQPHMLWGIEEYGVRGACEQKLHARPVLHAPNASEVRRILGVNACKFLLDWHKLQPTPNTYNETWLQFYRAMIDEITAVGMEPIATLHDSRDPHWFTLRGGWLKRENTGYFVAFARFCFLHFSAQVKYWETMKEPNAHVLRSTDTRPGRIASPDRLHAAFTMTKNMAAAHARTYLVLKSLPGGSAAHIGLSLRIDVCDPYFENSMLDKVAASYSNALAHGMFAELLAKGSARLYVPAVVDLHCTDAVPPQSMDFIGIGYHTRHIVALWREPTSLGERFYTQDGNEIYAEGMLRAARRLSVLFPSKDLLVAANDITDRRERYRRLFYERHLYALSRVVEAGIRLNGYITRGVAAACRISNSERDRKDLLDTQRQPPAPRPGSAHLVAVIRRWATDRAPQSTAR